MLGPGGFVNLATSGAGLRS